MPIYDDSGNRYVTSGGNLVLDPTQEAKHKKEDSSSILGELGKGATTGFFGMNEAVNRALQYAGQLGMDTMGAGEGLRDFGKTGADYWAEKKEPYAPSVASISDVEGVRDFLKWGAWNVGQAGTQIAMTLPFAAIGRGAAGVKGLSDALIKSGVGKDTVAQLVRQGSTKELTDLAVKQGINKAVIESAVGKEALTGATGTAAKLMDKTKDWLKPRAIDIPIGIMTGGEVLGGQLERREKEGTPLAPLRALGTIGLATKLEELGIEGALSKFAQLGPEAAKFANKTFMRRVGEAGLSGALTEAPTEFLQTYAETLGIDPSKFFKRETLIDALEAAAAGGFSGGILGAGGGAISKNVYKQSMDILGYGDAPEDVRSSIFREEYERRKQAQDPNADLWAEWGKLAIENKLDWNPADEVTPDGLALAKSKVDLSNMVKSMGIDIDTKMLFQKQGHIGLLGYFEGKAEDAYNTDLTGRSQIVSPEEKVERKLRVWADIAAEAEPIHGNAEEIYESLKNKDPKEMTEKDWTMSEDIYLARQPGGTEQHADATTIKEEVDPLLSFISNEIHERSKTKTEIQNGLTELAGMVDYYRKTYGDEYTPQLRNRLKEVVLGSLMEQHGWTYEQAKDDYDALMQSHLRAQNAMRNNILPTGEPQEGAIKMLPSAPFTANFTAKEDAEINNFIVNSVSKHLYDKRTRTKEFAVTERAIDKLVQTSGISKDAVLSYLSQYKQKDGKVGIRVVPVADEARAIYNYENKITKKELAEENAPLTAQLKETFKNNKFPWKDVAGFFGGTVPTTLRAITSKREKGEKPGSGSAFTEAITEALGPQFDINNPTVDEDLRAALMQEEQNHREGASLRRLDRDREDFVSAFVSQHNASINIKMEDYAGEGDLIEPEVYATKKDKKAPEKKEKIPKEKELSQKELIAKEVSELAKKYKSDARFRSLSQMEPEQISKSESKWNKTLTEAELVEKELEEESMRLNARFEYEYVEDQQFLREERDYARDERAFDLGYNSFDELERYVGKTIAKKVENSVIQELLGEDRTYSDVQFNEDVTRLNTAKAYKHTIKMLKEKTLVDKIEQEKARRNRDSEIEELVRLKYKADPRWLMVIATYYENVEEFIDHWTTKKGDTPRPLQVVNELLIKQMAKMGIFTGDKEFDVEKNIESWERIREEEASQKVGSRRVKEGRYGSDAVVLDSLIRWNAILLKAFHAIKSDTSLRAVWQAQDLPYKSVSSKLFKQQAEDPNIASWQTRKLKDILSEIKEQLKRGEKIPSEMLQFYAENVQLINRIPEIGAKEKLKGLVSKDVGEGESDLMLERVNEIMKAIDKTTTPSMLKDLKNSRGEFQDLTIKLPKTSGLNITTPEDLVRLLEPMVEPQESIKYSDDLSFLFSVIKGEKPDITNHFAFTEQNVKKRFKDFVVKKLSKEDVAKLPEGITDRVRAVQDFYRLTYKPNPKVTLLVMNANEIIVDRTQFERGRGEYEGQAVVGSFRVLNGENVIALTRQAQMTHVEHELFHYIRRFLLTEKENEMLDSQFRIKNPKDPRENLDSAIEERICEHYEYHAWRAEVSGVFGKLLRFFQRIANWFRNKQPAINERIFELARLRSEELFNREPVDRLRRDNDMYAVAKTDSKEFKIWFGSSKIVKEDGSPVVMYHGTSKDKDFASFKKSLRGIFFTKDPLIASQYSVENDSMGYDLRNNKRKNVASRVVPVYLKVENPYVMTENDTAEYKVAKNYASKQKELVDKAIRLGHDGIYFKDGTVAVFSPNQIKSIYNNGSWSESTERISYKAMPKDGDRYAIANLYHGTDKRFKKFLISKIGAGEGNQAYGYGLYFTTKKEIAMWYADRVSKMKGTGTRNLYSVTLHKGKNADEYYYQDWYKPIPKEKLERLRELTGAREQAVEHIRPLEQELNSYGFKLNWNGYDPSTLKSFIDSSGKKYKISNFYDLDLDSMAESLKSAKEAAEVFNNLDEIERLVSLYDDNAPTFEVYDHFLEVFKPKMLMGIFKMAGIDGFQYQSPAEENSTNYVVFDDKDIDIDAVESYAVMREHEPRDPRRFVMDTIYNDSVDSAFTSPEVSRTISKGKEPDITIPEKISDIERFLKESAKNEDIFDMSNPDNIKDIDPIYYAIGSLRGHIKDLSDKYFIMQGGDLNWLDRLIGVPYFLGKKHHQIQSAVDIQTERERNRNELIHKYLRMSELFMKLKGKSVEKVEKVLIAGDRDLGAMYKSLSSSEKDSDRKLAEEIRALNGYTDNMLMNPKNFNLSFGKLNPIEIKAYRAVRATLDAVHDRMFQKAYERIAEKHKGKRWYALLKSMTGELTPYEVNQFEKVLRSAHKSWDATLNAAKTPIKNLMKTPQELEKIQLYTEKIMEKAFEKINNKSLTEVGITDEEAREIIEKAVAKVNKAEDLASDEINDAIINKMVKAYTRKFNQLKDKISEIRTFLKHHLAAVTVAERVKNGENLTEEQVERAINKEMEKMSDAEVNVELRELMTAYGRVMPKARDLSRQRSRLGEVIGYFPRERDDTKNHYAKIEKISYDEDGNEVKEMVYLNFFNIVGVGGEKIKKEMNKIIEDRGWKLYDPGVEYDPDDTVVQITIDRNLKEYPASFFKVSDMNLQRIVDTAIDMLKRNVVDNRTGDKIRMQMLKLVSDIVSERGFAKHNIERKHFSDKGALEAILGYKETGLQKVLMNYITGYAGYETKQDASLKFTELLSEVARSDINMGIKGKPGVRNYLQNYASDLLRNETRVDKISGYARSLAFAYYLGIMLKAPFVQLTQNYVTAIPFLAKHIREESRAIGRKSKLLAAEKIYHGSMKDIGLHGVALTSSKYRNKAPDPTLGFIVVDSKDTPLSINEQKFLHELITKGVAVDQYIQEITGKVTRNIGGAYNRVVRVMAYPFSQAEMFNRKSAGLAMFRAMSDLGYENNGLGSTAGKMAEEFIYQTHYLMGKSNLPDWARGGGLGGQFLRMAYTFRSFTHNYLLSMAPQYGGDMKTAIRSLAYLTILGGAMALPFLKDIFEFIQKGYGIDIMSTVKKELKNYGGETLEKFGIYGLAGLMVGDISGSLSIGIPFVGEPTDTIYGVWGGMFRKIKYAGQAAARGDIPRVIENLSPEAIANMSRAMRMSDIGNSILGMPGYATTSRGRPIFGEDGKPISLSETEAFAKILGFQPTGYSQKMGKQRMISNVEDYFREERLDIIERYRVAKSYGRSDAMAKAVKDITRFNDERKYKNVETLIPRLKLSSVIEGAKVKKTAQQKRQGKYMESEA